MQLELIDYYRREVVTSPTGSFSRCHAHIWDLYAEPSLIRSDYASSPRMQKKYPILCENMFKKKEKKKHHLIYLTGDAGTGKTSLCKDLVASWCDSICPGRKIEENDKMTALRQFDLLFYIPLRLVRDTFAVMDMVKTHLLHDDAEKYEVFFDFLMQDSERCLVILDGMDEWKAPRRSPTPAISNGIPGGNPFVSYTMLTTSRPWKFVDVRLRDNEVDLSIELKGIKNPREFCEKSLNCLNRYSMQQKKYEDFDTFLKSRGLEDAFEIPILLKHLLSLWHADQYVGNSKMEVYTDMIELLFQLAEEREGVNQFVTKETLTPSEISLPSCFKSKVRCEMYKSILLSSGHFAYKTLLESEINKAFDASQSIKTLPRHVLDVCLRVGFISQGFVPDKVCERKTVTFLHTSFHEYFVALYLSINESCSETLEAFVRSKCGSVESMVEVEGVVMFLSEMCPGLMKKLAPHIGVVINRDHSFRNHGRTPTVVSRFQDLLVKVQSGQK